MSSNPKKKISEIGASAIESEASVKKLFGTISDSFKKNLSVTGFIDARVKLEDESAKLAREVMGQGRMVITELEKNLARASARTAKFNIGLEDNVKLIGDMNTAFQRNIFLTEEQIERMQLLAMNAGLTSNEIASMVTLFDNIGVNTEKAISNIAEMESEARKYGLNVSQFMGEMEKNLKELNKFNFRNGIEGFTRMLSVAQSLRMDVQRTFSLAENLLDPENAIEMAAGFQMLGGEIGALGDPFSLLHMAQNDAEGLQNAIIDMAKSSAMFNEQTGEFEIATTEVYKLREAAKLTGQSWEELSNTAILSASKMMKMDMLDGLLDDSFSDEDKELIANLSQIEGGRVMLNMGDGKIDVGELESKDIDKLRQFQEEASKSERDIAIGQLTTLQSIEGIVKGLDSVGFNVALSSDLANDMSEILKKGALSFNETITNMDEESSILGIVNKLDEIGKNVLSGEVDADDVNLVRQELIDDFLKLTKDTISTTSDNFKESINEGNMFVGSANKMVEFFSEAMEEGTFNLKSALDSTKESINNIIKSSKGESQKVSPSAKDEAEIREQFKGVSVNNSSGEIELKSGTQKVQVEIMNPNGNKSLASTDITEEVVKLLKSEKGSQIIKNIFNNSKGDYRDTKTV